LYVTISEIHCQEAGVRQLADAFRGRLHAVDSLDGFLGLEVLQDRRRSDRFLMITRWDSRSTFLRYMKSDKHRASHARIPRDPARPRAAGLTEYDVVAT
jgi:heme oxygenase (mycobilin-producing)